MASGQITVGELYSLEEYSQRRGAFREKAIEHQKNRRVTLGEHLLICFEDKLTVRYQLQEVLRAARVFERSRIESEIAAYAALLPTGRDFKATMMLQIPMQAGNRQSPDLTGLGECIWMQYKEYPRVFATSDSSQSAIQWLSFEMTRDACANMQMNKPEDDGSRLTLGVEHPHYCYEQTLPAVVFRSLVADLESDVQLEGGY